MKQKNLVKLFLVKIYHNKAILRYKNFKSVAKEDTTKTRTVLKKHTIQFKIGGLQECKIIFFIN